MGKQGIISEQDAGAIVGARKIEQDYEDRFELREDPKTSTSTSRSSYGRRSEMPAPGCILGALARQVATDLACS
jgi:hypothetical protein